MISHKLFSLPLMFALSTSAFAVSPDEPLTKNPDYVINSNQRSIDIQGLGNKILDEASSAQYLVRQDNKGTEYAYSFKRLGSNDIKYTGNTEDVAGYIYFKLTVYHDGAKVQEQTTAFIPSEYTGAIKFLKMDRDEKPRYDFDFGMDAKNRLYIITSPTDVVYLDKKETIKDPAKAKDKYNQYVF